MYKVLDKDIIEMEIVPNIPMPRRRFPPPRVELSEIVNAVLYKMKTGVQWEYLPVTALFGERPLTWQGVYYHFRKWCLSGTFYRCWRGLLEKYRDKRDLSSVNRDGTHTPAIRGGQGVEYQGHKRRKTTNALYLADRDCPWPCRGARGGQPKRPI